MTTSVSRKTKLKIQEGQELSDKVQEEKDLRKNLLRTGPVDCSLTVKVTR